LGARFNTLIIDSDAILILDAIFGHGLIGTCSIDRVSSLADASVVTRRRPRDAGRKYPVAHYPVAALHHIHGNAATICPGMRGCLDVGDAVCGATSNIRELRPPAIDGNSCRKKAGEGWKDQANIRSLDLPARLPIYAGLVFFNSVSADAIL